MESKKLRIRRSLIELQHEYENGNRKPLEDLMKAWSGIQSLPPDNPNSFFKIGGYHGEPFRGAGWGNASWWGGYCNHGNVLFPTWHRAYLLRLEDALRSIPGCEEVTLPFWDETNPDSLKNGIPWALTDEFFPRDSKNPNPLRSYKFPISITDNISTDNPNYTKNQGYETVRYPLSGLVGPNDQANTAKYNANFTVDTALAILNQNVNQWLNTQIVINSNNRGLVFSQYAECLKAPNYTVFSNVTSAQEYNNSASSYSPKRPLVTPLESPHNSIHLAVGGLDITGYNADMNPLYQLANGDMGENDTAGLDPIFYFHHCNVDRMFWIWQKLHQSGPINYMNELDIIEAYPGTNSVDNQGPTAGVAGGTWLTLDSPLTPFRRKDGAMYTSRDCVNIETQLGYTYGPGSFDDTVLETPTPTLKASEDGSRTLAISNINRAPIRGSFVVTAHVTHAGKKHLLGAEAVLSRWGQKFCANCQTHQEVKVHFHLPSEMKSVVEDDIEVGLHTHDAKILHRKGVLSSNAAAPHVKPVKIKIH